MEDWEEGLTPVQSQATAPAEMNWEDGLTPAGDDLDWEAGLTPVSMGVMGTAKDIGKGVLAGIPQIGANLLGGAEMAIGGIAGALGATDTADQLFRSMEDRQRSINQFNQENLPTGTAGNIARSVTGMAGTFVNPATAMLGAAGMTGQQAPGLFEQIQDPEVATRALQMQAVLNTVLGRFGFGPGSSYLKEIGINVGTGAGINKLTQMYLESKGEAKAGEQFDPTDMENWLTDALAAIAGKRIAGSRTPAAQQPTPTPPDMGGTPRTPEAAVQPSPDGLPPVDFSELPPQLPQLDYGKQTRVGQELARQRAEQPAPLPEIRDIQDQVPLLPETPMIQEGAPAETPLPQMDEALLRAKIQGLDPTATGGLLDFADPSAYPQDRGVRHLDPDTGRVVQGMDESVPTIDFPLRQEVLQRPEVKAAVTRFKKRAAEATTDLARQKVENDFAAYMNRYGVSDAQGATGLRRALYEGSLRDPSAIRKSGELDLTKTETEVPAVSDAFLRSQRKQAGAINPDLLGLGKAADLLGRLGSRGLWNKFRGTFDPKSMAAVEANAKNPNARETLVWMSPEDFLALAKARRALGTPEGNYLAEQKRSSIRKGVASEEGLTSQSPEWAANAIPQLWVEPASQNAELGLRNSTPDTGAVFGHEGRHRADVFMEMGVDLMPVRMINAKGTQGIPYRSLVGEDGAARPYPTDRVFPSPQRPVVPKGQRGAIDLKEITAGLSVLAEKAKGILKNPSKSEAPESLPDRQRAAISKIPGMVGLESYISKDIPNDQIKAKILEQGDISSSLNFLIGGKEAMSAIKRHPAIYWVGSKFTNARKRADLYHRSYLAPLEVQVSRLSNIKELGPVMDVLKQEMLQNTQFDAETLRSKGLNDRQVTLYDTFRTEYDRALEKINEYRAQTGQKPVSRYEGYMASRWSGDWKAPVYDKSGKLVMYIAESSKGRAKHALDWLTKNRPDLDISKSQVRYDKDFFMTEESHTLASYQDLINILGKDDPVVLAMEAANRERLDGERILGHYRHLEPKAGIRGFMGDRPWVNDAKNTLDSAKSQLAYLRNTHTWAELQTAVKDVNEILADTEVQEKTPKLTNLLHDIKQNEMGFPTVRWLGQAERSASKWLSEAADAMSEAFPPLKNMPTDLRSINTGMGWAKSYFYMTKLGIFNLPFAAISVVQPIYTLPHHVDLTQQGYKHNAAKTLADSIMHGTRAMIGGALGGKDSTALSGVYKEAYKYMLANGVGDLNQYAEAHDIGLSPMAHKIRRIGGITMTESERFARSVAFMGYVSHLDQSGAYKGNDMSMFQKAEELTNLSMANYRHTERAGMFNKTGLLGNAAATLNTFKINQFNQLYLLGKKAAKDGNYKPLMAMLGVQTIMAGALGMYGLDEIEDLYNYFKDAAIAGGLLTDQDAIKWSPKFEIQRTLPDALAYGLPSVATDRNYAARMSAGNVVDPTMAGILPFVTDYAKQVSSVAQLAGDVVRGKSAAVSADRAAQSLMPSSLKSWYEMNSAFGTMTDPQGNPYPKTGPQDAIQYRRTPEDIAAKEGTMGGGVPMPFTGMSSLNEAKNRDIAYRAQQFDRRVTDAQKAQNEAFQTAVRAQDLSSAAKAFKGYIQAGGDPKVLLQGAESAVLRRFFTQDEWQMLQSKGLQNAQSIARKQKYLQEVR
jgi:hypothetical protein